MWPLLSVQDFGKPGNLAAELGIPFCRWAVALLLMKHVAPLTLLCHCQAECLCPQHLLPCPTLCSMEAGKRYSAGGGHSENLGASKKLAAVDANVQELRLLV